MSGAVPGPDLTPLPKPSERRARCSFELADVAFARVEGAALPALRLKEAELAVCQARNVPGGKCRASIGSYTRCVQMRRSLTPTQEGRHAECAGAHFFGKVTECLAKHGAKQAR